MNIMSERLDDELREFFKSSSALFPPLAPDASPLARRSRYWTVCALGRTDLPSGVTMNDVTLDLASGKVRTRLFYGHDGGDEPVPTIIYFHGGGWVVGDIDTHTGTCARLAHEANALVCSVDYPLAPEAPWRAITDACFQAANAIAMDRMAASPGAPIAIAGDSAGAHLAAVTALRVRDESEVHLALQALIYPCVEPQFDTPSYREFAAGPGLTRVDMQWYWQQFAGGDVNLPHAAISPLRAASLSGLPPAYVVTAGCDPLRDDGRAFVNALQSARVIAHHDEFESLPHGFLRMSKYSDATHAAIGHINRRIGEMLRSANT